MRLTGVIPPSKAASNKLLQAAKEKEGKSKEGSEKEKESKGGKESEVEASKAKFIRLTAEQVHKLLIPWISFLININEIFYLLWQWVT